ncbi:hypothetical protein HS1genome_1561 [Sulfodiicoccus acidiphilus]|uniref:Adenosylcobinamide amidohydrolase n=1 Tax=Sulfodiicoccus acidiphilus TaxID=1670455 RepID=A0A348B4S0_9CREN|nr:adenosylcobinamide amidohydrolase [Sulfodiicoccus acidiphilus]BBD73172.1 hypothetical protein HS1genome_1561 [Sulfodiicoccus acidiphilus]GGU01291.1 hypothetical protein GCM10007116_18070 [Sulfodiicoccus acidiphilus]
MKWKERWWRDAVLYEVVGESLASTVFGGGRCDGAIFMTVGDSFQLSEVDGYLEGRLRALGVGGRLIAFLTKVDVATREVIEGKDHLVVSTAGLTNPSCPREVGTINVFVAVEASPVGNAMADLFRLVTEAKSAAAFSLGLRCGDLPCPGTVSDAIGVAFTGGDPLRFVGLGTGIGDAVYTDVIKAVRTAAGRWSSWRGDLL